MKKIFIFIFLFLLSAAGRAQRNTLYTVLTSGPPTKMSQIAAYLSPKFGFRYKYIGYQQIGDVICPPNFDSMRKQNARAYKLIAKKHGRHWQEKFKKEVDRTFENCMRIEHFLDSSTTFENLLANPALKNDGFFHILKEPQANTIFIIEYTFYNTGKDTVNSKKRFRVDLSKPGVSAL